MGYVSFAICHYKDGKQSTVQWLETVVLVKDEKQWKVKHLIQH